MFKLLLDHVGKKHIKMIDIITYMEQLVVKNTPPEELRESTDLIQEIIKKGGPT